MGIDNPDQKKLMNKAAKLLSHKPYTCGEMRLKLLKLGSEPDVGAVLNHLKELKLLNDTEYAYNYALHRIKQEGWGPLKVYHALLRRQIAVKVAQSAVEQVRDALSENEVLDEYLEKHCRKTGVPDDRKSIQKLIAHLRRRGFHDENIRTALRRKIPSAAWQAFDPGD